MKLPLRTIRLVPFLLAASLLVMGQISSAAPQQQSFAQFIEKIKQEALAKGIPAKTIDMAFKNVKLLHRAVHADHHQAEFTATFKHYVDRHVSPTRIAQGMQKIKAHTALLNQIAKRYQVPYPYIVALWGLETNYGRNQGHYPEFSVLATLAYNPRRSRIFKHEIFAALTMLAKGHASMADMRGSWAGALGQCQFLPSTYLAYAVDYHHKGRADIWHNTADVLASIANYLAKQHWQPQQTLVMPVTLKTALGPDHYGVKHSRSFAAWLQLGILPQGKFTHLQGQYFLLAPDGKTKQHYLVGLHNYKIILRWNHSTHYALAVGLLANKFGA